MCRGVFLALAFAGLLAGCKKSNEYVAPPPPQVSVAVPLKQEVTRYLETTGIIAAINTVPLVARVNGFLYSQNYVDGTEMKNVPVAAFQIGCSSPPEATWPGIVMLPLTMTSLSEASACHMAVDQAQLRETFPR